MHTGGIIVHVKQGDHRNMVLDLLTESVRQARKPSHVHPHVEILALHIAS